MSSSTIKSILTAECGHTTTTAILIELVNEEYRVTATGQTPSTHVAPWQDITLGVQGAVRHIEQQIGRTLLTPGGWPITPQTAAHQGTDIFIVVVSAGKPLELLLAGLTQDISLKSAFRAAGGVYSRVTGVVALDMENEDPESHLQTVMAQQADVILLTGGTDGGATQPLIHIAQLIALALQASNQKDKPRLIYAGNTQLRPQMADILGNVAALNSVDNLRPLLDYENPIGVTADLEKIYIEKLEQLPGFDKLKNWSQHQVTPAARSFEKLITFLGQFHKLNVLGTSIGSKSTVISAHVVDHPPRTTIRSDVGLGQSLPRLLETISVEDIHRWLPFDFPYEKLDHYLLNKCIYPATIPTSPEDLMIEHALVREALRVTMRQTYNQTTPLAWNMIIGSGRPLTGAPQAAHAALVMLDGFQPWGVTTLMLDKSGVVNVLGSIAAIAPAAAVQVTQKEAFLNLGTVIAPAGRGAVNQPALSLTVTYPDESVEKFEVRFGQLARLPLPVGQHALVEIRPSHQFDIGLGQPGRGAVAQIEGGLLGIIVDARGRPLILPDNDLERQQQLQQWLQAMDIIYAPPISYNQ
jgi:hypothetical protein